MKRLIDWARQQKRRGKLKLAFRVYSSLKRREAKTRTAIHIWWRRNVTRAICQWGVALRPNWGNGHYALGEALQQQSSFLSRLKSYDATELIDIRNQAAIHYRKALELNPERLETYGHLIGILGDSGRTDEASIVLQQLNDLKRNLAEACQEDGLALRFVPRRIVMNVGLLGHLIGYVKAGLLGWRPPHKTILLLPDEASVSNPCFLDYWRQYITVISDPDMIKTLTPLVDHLEDPIQWALTCNGQALFMPAAITMVQKQWDAEKRPPLMTLSASDYERGWRCLEALGVPRDAWFVCLHVRDSGFKDGGSKTDSYRNADIDTYLLAIETIVAHGGWVIRMGDPTMKPLSAIEHVIDYAHSDVRSDWMDVFLCAQCRFLIGTSSGLYLVSMAFGVPIVQTNYLPWNSLLLSSKDLFLPKLLWSLDENRHLTFSEILSSPLSGGVSQSFYDYSGVEILENTPEEINDIVLEMLVRLDGKLTYSVSDGRLQKRFRSLTAACNTSLGAKDLTFICQIGKDFLRKYATLLDALPEAADCLQDPKEHLAVLEG